jgi:hypothetical protein
MMSESVTVKGLHRAGTTLGRSMAHSCEACWLKEGNQHHARGEVLRGWRVSSGTLRWWQCGQGVTTANVD